MTLPLFYWEEIQQSVTHYANKTWPTWSTMLSFTCVRLSDVFSLQFGRNSLVKCISSAVWEKRPIYVTGLKSCQNILKYILQIFNVTSTMICGRSHLMMMGNVTIVWRNLARKQILNNFRKYLEHFWLICGLDLFFYIYTKFGLYFVNLSDDVIEIYTDTLRINFKMWHALDMYY